VQEIKDMAVKQKAPTKSLDLFKTEMPSILKETKTRETVLKDLIISGILKNGGFVNTHSHLDRAYTISAENLHLAKATLKEKWFLVDSIKKNSTVYQIYYRMAYALEKMVQQNVQAVGTFIDIDEVMEDKAIKAAQLIREHVSGSEIKIKFINQTLKGVINPDARKWFELGAQFVDIIGGLPAKDAGYEEEHLDILMETAKKYNKPVHVHVDQFNSPSEKETELLAKKTIQHGLEGKVTAIHCISTGAHKKEYREELYRLMNKAKLNVICCPTAWIDSKRSEELAPIHNSITPVDEMTPAGINIALGTDNIADILKPFTDGDMWTEVRFLLESCRFYNIQDLINISSINGLKVLDLI
jgi:cytosine/adenosine deaminase-related metal-dependent hydrolase